jgi:hypothetical protein
MEYMVAMAAIATATVAGAIVALTLQIQPNG